MMTQQVQEQVQDQVTEVLELPMVQVVLPEGEPDPAPFSLAEALRPGEDAATVADDLLLQRVALFLDMPEDALAEMKVTRPSTGNVLISAPFSFGG